MKTTKKLLSVFLALLMIISIIPMSSITASAATTRTADEAIVWCESNLGKGLDFDGNGYYCVDLTVKYYQYLGVTPYYGNANTYAEATPPSGWTKTKGGIPQKGDILVYTGGLGHVAIFESTNVSYHQNWSGAYVEKVNRPYNQSYTYGGNTISYWGCIHPDFKNSTPTPDIDWVTGLAGQYYLQGKSTGSWLAVSEGKDASTQPINTWGNWGTDFRINLTAIGNGYKMKFPKISSLLVNPYSDTPTVGTKINLYQDVNDSTQWWGFEKVGDAYAIRSMYNTSLCLTDNGVNQATLTTYTGAANQLWYLHPYTTTVSYNANGGSGAPSSQTKYFNENLTLSSTKPTRSGYTFLGWSTSSTATSATYSAGSSFTTNANTTLYAVWKANTYTVSYNANGGTGAPSSQTKTHGTTLILSSTIPTRSGYTFLGWSTSSTASTPTYYAGGSFTANANTTLYAVWEATLPSYTVSFDANGGTGAPASQLIYHGQYARIPDTIPTKNGYTFEGWVAEDSYLLLEPGDGWLIDSPTTFVAVWTPNEYTVSYNANGGTGAPSSQTKYHDTALTLSTTVPTRSGYTFLGWSTSSIATTASYQSGASFTLNADTTLYAVWQKDVIAPEVYVSTTSVDLTLGGTESTDVTVWAKTDKTYQIYYAIGDTSVVSCLWGSWDSNMKIPLTITANSKGTTTVTLTLQDKETGDTLDSIVINVTVGAKEYTVSYNANGGAGAPANQTKVHGTALTLSNTVPTRSGYTFLGWSENSTATTATYSAGSSFTTNANTTLYAVWQENVIVVPEICVSSTSVNLTLGETESTVVYAWGTGTTSSYTVQYQIADTNIIGCSWGEWTSDNKSPLTITAKSKGTTTVTVSLVDYETKAILDSVVVTVNVGASTSNVNFSIRQPSTTTIRYKDGIVLHIDGNIPDGARVEWSIDSNAFDGGIFDNGMSCLLVSQNNGYATVMATLYDANDNVLATDSVELRSKAGFFDKIGGFFRSLFGTTKVYDA